MEQFVGYIESLGFPIVIAGVMLMFMFKMFNLMREDSKVREERYFEQMGKFDGSINNLNNTMQDMSETMKQQSAELKAVVDKVEKVTDKVESLSLKVDYLEKKS